MSPNLDKRFPYDWDLCFLLDRKSVPLVKKAVEDWNVSGKRHPTYTVTILVEGEKKTILLQHHDLTYDGTYYYPDEEWEPEHKTDLVITCYPGYLKKKPEGLLFDEFGGPVYHWWGRRGKKYYLLLEAPDKEAIPASKIKTLKKEDKT